MRDGTWLRKVRYLAISLGALASLIMAGGANWPRH